MKIYFQKTFNISKWVAEFAGDSSNVLIVEITILWLLLAHIL